MTVSSRRIAPIVLLVLFGLATVGWCVMFVRLAAAPTVAAEVTKTVYRNHGQSDFHVVFPDDAGGTCRSIFVTNAESHAVGDTVNLRHTGCANLREVGDKTWWLPFPLGLLVLAGNAGFVALGWGGPKTLRRLGRLTLRSPRPPALVP